MIRGAIQKAIDGRDLTRVEAREAMTSIMSGDATQAQIGGLLVALRVKGETADEIAGCAEAMRDHVLAVHPRRQDLVDTAGTGGDGAQTLNISTASALVAASAGAGVAKHGNRAVSSASGSADVLEALGLELELPPERIERSIDELGFGFLFAPMHHPAMRHAAPARRELATRTVFNVLGPLTNPAGARAQVVGVYAPDLVQTIAEVLVQLGARRAFVVHGAHGVDELSPAGPNLVWEVEHGRAWAEPIDPLDLGIPRCDPAELRGGTPAENARAIREVFEGKRGGARDAIVLNAAGAIAGGDDEDAARGTPPRGSTPALRDGLPVAPGGDGLTPAPPASCSTRLIAFSHEEVPAVVGRLSRGGEFPKRFRGPDSRRSPSSNAVRLQRATSARAPIRRSSRPDTQARALPRSRFWSTSASPDHSTISALRARRQRCRCSRKDSSASLSICVHAVRPGPTLRS